MKKKRLKKQNLILLERCRKLEKQRDALLEAYLRNNPKVSEWLDKQVKRQMRKTNAAS